MSADKLFTLTQQGRDALIRLDRDAATACFRQALEEDPKFIDALTGLGQVAYERGELDAAAKYFVQAADLGKAERGGGWSARLDFQQPADRACLRAIHGQGIVAYRQGDSALAKTHFALEQRLDPADHQGARYILKNIAAGKRWRET